MELGREPTPARRPGGGAAGAVSLRDQQQPARGVVPFDRGAAGRVGSDANGLFPADREVPDLSCKVVLVKVGDERPRQRGRVLAGADVLGQAGAEPVLGAAAAGEPAGARWLDVLKAQACYQLVDAVSVPK